MRPQEDPRNQPINFRTIARAKSNHSTTSIRSAKQHSQPLLFRQRENNSIVNQHSRNKKQEKNQQYTDYTAAKNNYMRQHQNSLSEVPAKRNQPGQHHVLINVNIQDLVTPRNILMMQNCSSKKETYTPKMENHGGIGNIGNNAQRKPASKVQNRDLQCLEFECNEEIVYTKKTSPPPRERTISKQHPSDPKSKPYQLSQKSREKPEPAKIISPQQQQLIKFNSTIDQINSIFTSDSLSYLDFRQQLYQISPTYIEDYQPNFTWKMRAFVVEWMMEVAEQFFLKRQTFHVSINLADRYFEREANLCKSSFQGIAAACLFIASKLEEHDARSSEEFAISTGRLVTAVKLNQMQRRVCHVLKYNFHPPTLFRWANRLMLQWDAYITMDPCAKIHPFFATNLPKLFKQTSEEAYINYRLLIQLIDCSTLDIETSQYSPKLLVCSFMYLYLLKEYKFYGPKEIALKFPDSSRYLFDQDNLFNDLYNQFLEFTFGFVLPDLLPTIQYCASFFLLPPNVEMPAPARKNSKICQDMELEEYESFQTFDKNMLKVVLKRARNNF